MLKHLRIAVTALCLTACVLLIALWVRSYWWENSLCLHRPNSNELCCTTLIGHFYVYWGEDLFSEPGVPGTTNEWSFENWNVKQRWGAEIFNDQDFVRGFSYYSDNENVSVSVPLWSLALLAGGLAAVQWLPWSKRFSLRTLLIATALVAVGLGVFVVSR
jgi:hypothetical protein